MVLAHPPQSWLAEVAGAGATVDGTVGGDVVGTFREGLEGGGGGGGGSVVVVGGISALSTAKKYAGSALAVATMEGVFVVVGLGG